MKYKTNFPAIKLAAALALIYNVHSAPVSDSEPKGYLYYDMANYADSGASELTTPEITLTDLTPEIVQSDLTPEIVQSDLTPGIVESDLTPGIMQSDLSPEIMQSDLTPEIVNFYPFEATTQNNAELEISELVQLPQSFENVQSAENNRLIILPEIAYISEESEVENNADNTSDNFDEETEVVRVKETDNQSNDDLQVWEQSPEEEPVTEGEEEGEEEDDDEEEELGDDSADCDSINCDLTPKIPEEVLMALRETKTYNLNIPDPDPSADLIMELQLCISWWTTTTGNTIADDDNAVASSPSLLDASKMLANCTPLAIARIFVRGLENKTTEVSFPLAKDNDALSMSKEGILMQNEHELDALEAPSDQEVTDNDNHLFQPFVSPYTYDAFQSDLATTTSEEDEEEHFHAKPTPSKDFGFGPYKDFDTTILQNNKDVEGAGEDKVEDDETVVTYREDMNLFYVESDGNRPLFNPFYILPILLTSFVVALAYVAVSNKFKGDNLNNNTVLKVPRMAFCSSVPDFATLKVVKKVEEDKKKIIV